MLEELLRILRDPACVRQLASTPDSWSRVKQTAQHHRFSGLLAYRCAKFAPLGDGAWCLRTVAAHAAAHTTRLRALKAVTGVLDKHGIRYVSLKGPVLAERYWTHPFLKVSVDLDLLIDPSNLWRACDALVAAGFSFDRNEYQPWWFHSRESHHVLLMPVAGVQPCVVELHYRLPWQLSITGSEMLDRSIGWTAQDGARFSVASPADEALNLVVHAVRHEFARLGWLYDTWIVLRKLDDSDRDRVVSQARTSGQMRRLMEANSACVRYFGEPLIPELRAVRGSQIVAALPVRRHRLIDRLHSFPRQCRWAGSWRNLAQVVITFIALPVLRRLITAFRSFSAGSSRAKG